MILHQKSDEYAICYTCMSVKLTFLNVVLTFINVVLPNIYKCSVDILIINVVLNVVLTFIHVSSL